MARKRSKAKAKAKSKVKGGDVARKAQALIGFHKFTDLPTELRLMIIEEALQEDQKARPPRVVLFDHHTYRISPFAEQSRGLSPMLFVNKQFRSAALKIYVMLNVIDLGIAWIGKYGDDESWYNEDGELQYSLDVAKMVDAAGNEGDEDYEGIKGRVYIRPTAEIFVTGLVPRQINETDHFSYLLDNYEQGPWDVPMCHITECLPLAACARIATMRDLVWDPGCPHCGDYHPIHCRDCFLEGRGKELVKPAYDTVTYSHVKEFGIYVMSGEMVPETLMYNLAIAKHPTRDFLLDMYDRHVVGFPVPA